jgi:pSer/pThr/pTyr-binding forkhead associated (FHA) protein
MVGEEGHVVVLRESRYEIGRTADCAIQAEDANVSRRHAVLVARDGEWTIEDLESTNGTWLRGERVKHAVLRDGDIVTVGATRLFFRSGRG